MAPSRCLDADNQWLPPWAPPGGGADEACLSWAFSIWGADDSPHDDDFCGLANGTTNGPQTRCVLSCCCAHAWSWWRSQSKDVPRPRCVTHLVRAKQISHQHCFPITKKKSSMVDAHDLQETSCS